MHEGSRRAIIAAFLANLGIAIAKFIGFAFTGAASMLAESVHSVADTGNQGLLLLGSERAKKAPTPRHPFGYGRERYFWAFLVAVILFTIGAVFAMFEGVEKLRHPHELESTSWAVGILLVAIGLETWSFRTAIHEGNKQREGRPWWEFIRHARTPEIPVVFLEDLGALVGLVLALVGVSLATLTGDARWDALGSVSIGLLLGVIAVVLATEMKSLLIGESATERHQAAIREAIESDPSVHRLIHLRTQHIGPEELLVGAKVEFDGGLSFAALAGAIDALEARVRDRVPEARVMYVEPDVHRGDRA